MELEIGYHVNRERWGQGFATEAAKAVMDYAFRRFDVERVVSMIRPENTASRRVAEKNGLTVDRVVFWRTMTIAFISGREAAADDERGAGRERKIREDANDVLNASVSYAKRMLRRYGEFGPVWLRDESGWRVKLEAIVQQDMPAGCPLLLDLLQQQLTERARRGALQATARRPM